MNHKEGTQIQRDEKDNDITLKEQILYEGEFHFTAKSFPLEKKRLICRKVND